MLRDGTEVLGPFPKLDSPEAWSALAEADGAVMSSRPKCNGAWMDRAPRIRVLARSGIGYDNIDVDAATARGICVVNTPEAPTEPTAEQAITFILMLARRIKESDRALSEGRWLPRRELEGTDQEAAQDDEVSQVVNGETEESVQVSGRDPAKRAAGVHRAGQADLENRSGSVVRSSPAQPRTR